MGVVMLVLSLDCLRGVFAGRPAAGTDAAATEARFETYAAKEGALVLALNMAAMLAIQALHVSNADSMKIERDRDIMKRQAKNAGETAMLMMQQEKKAVETKMPEEKAD